MPQSAIRQAANVAVSSDLAAEARFMLFKAALTVGDKGRIQSARQDAEDAFAARLDAHAALYVLGHAIDGGT